MSNHESETSGNVFDLSKYRQARKPLRARGPLSTPRRVDQFAPPAEDTAHIDEMREWEQDFRDIFGEDFFGVDTILSMESDCRAAGLNLTFDRPKSPPPYDRELLEVIKSGQQGRQSVFGIYRPEFMTYNGSSLRVTLNHLRHVFRETNPFGSGALFDPSSAWVDREPFAQDVCEYGYSIPTKVLIAESKGLEWEKQNEHLVINESRRTSADIAWDLIAYYAMTGSRLLLDTLDWTDEADSKDNFVYVGEFTERGMKIGSTKPTEPLRNLGIAPQQ